MGISVASSFDMQAQLPLDSRFKVADLTARDALPSGIRYEGMIVYVVSTDIFGNPKTYQLQDGIANVNWTEFGGTSTGVEIDLTNLTYTRSYSGGLATYTTPVKHGLKVLDWIQTYGIVAGTAQIATVPTDFTFTLGPGGSTANGTGYYVPDNSGVIYDLFQSKIKLGPPKGVRESLTEPDVSIGLAYIKTLPVGTNITKTDDLYIQGPLTIPSGSVLTISAGTTYNVL